jgi:hypothetical protein
LPQECFLARVLGGAQTLQSGDNQAAKADLVDLDQGSRQFPSDALVNEGAKP